VIASLMALVKDQCDGTELVIPYPMQVRVNVLFS